MNAEHDNMHLAIEDRLRRVEGTVAKLCQNSIRLETVDSRPYTNESANRAAEQYIKQEHLDQPFRPDPKVTETLRETLSSDLEQRVTDLEHLMKTMCTIVSEGLGRGVVVEGTTEAGAYYRMISASENADLLPKVQSRQLREALAELAHEQWAGWMESLFQIYDGKHPQWNWNGSCQHWRKQVDTPYAELSEEEKDSDRREADRMLDVFSRFGLLDVPKKG
jgi:hypothetical protein